MSIRKLFFIIYSGIIVLSLGIAAVSLLMLQNQRTLNEKQQTRYQSYLAADELRQSSDDLTRLARTYVVTTDKKHESRYWEILDIRNGKKPRPDGSTIPLKKIMENLGFTKEEFAKLTEAANNSDSLVTTETIAMNAVKGLYDDGTGKYVKKGEPDFELARRIMFDAKYHGDKALIMGPIDDFFRMLDKRTGDTVSSYEARGDRYLFMSIGLILFLIAMAIYSFFIIYRKIIVPLSVASHEIGLIARGDLTRRVAIDQKDEIGTLASLLNDMTLNLKQMIHDVTDGVGTLSTSSGELTHISARLNDNSEQTCTRSVTVSSSAEEMSTNMHAVAAAMEEASGNVAMIATSSEEMSATINEIAGNSEKARSISNDAVTQAKIASTRVDELGIAAREIGKVTETITDISEQTSLLALNATIEAARAGDAGKGFAVVANEIKELSRQTFQATQDIREKIDNIQSTAETSISVIEAISRVITDINEIVTVIASSVEEQSIATREIAGNAAHASTGLAEVNENVANSSLASGEITREIAEVNRQAGAISDNSAIVNQRADELSELAERLEEMVKRFTV